jgi:hypothetical protein
MTPEQLAAIKARAEAATPGPWVPEFSDIYLQKYGPEYCWESGYFVLRSPEGAVVDYWANQADDSGLLLERPDAEFIANARQDVPALLAEVERLQRAAAAYEVELAATAERSFQAGLDYVWWVFRGPFVSSLLDDVERLRAELKDAREINLEHRAALESIAKCRCGSPLHSFYCSAPEAMAALRDFDEVEAP